ncbi:IclR family transcriptional regulator [Bradyrhizobium sp. KBS0727]|uniref:IclR family transcriptional regulator n=1 Tax=unclassified Bradyrhizobium TaxID=2631580 RepID=UPI00110E58F3|nr:MULTISPECIES: IclR family transcriptional regulator [unclassified Bradyrhizobium]QDW40508.1 IclR family transcriptional regulator [Bradyrhizobium sp. KBS0725]QDW47113.1 IclR family transcriptional regulator [Bradyrhizobium sp. KBS0727]
MKARTENGNQSLIRGLRILESYTSSKQGWGIRELGRALDIDAATTYRMVSTLADRGYLEQNPETQKYHLGPKVVQLAANYATHNSLIEISLRIFAKYESQFPYNFYVGVMGSDDVTYIAVYESRGPLKITTEVGQSVSLFGSAMGRLLISFESDDFIENLLAKKPIEKITPLTLTSPKDLMRQIRQIRKNGYAVNRGEIYEEIAAVATPITGFDGTVVAGLALCFPLHYLDTKKLDLDETIRLAQVIADELSVANRSTVIRRNSQHR